MTLDYYQINADKFFNSTVNVDMSDIYNRFTANLPKQALILDAGCGSGRDTKAFIGMGYSVNAFDASSELAARASAYAGIEVSHSTFDDVNQTQLYDGIWCCASLLHVPENKLEATLEKLVNALKFNGLMYVSFKYGDSEREVGGRTFTDLNPERLNMFSRNLKDIQLKDLWISEDNRPDRDEKWLNAILLKNQ
jgi:SAM-dependent methyltransferase